jgi:hypothetical protein
MRKFFVEIADLLFDFADSLAVFSKIFPKLSCFSR